MRDMYNIPLITGDGAAYFKGDMQEYEIFEKQCDENEKFWKELLNRPDFHGCELSLSDRHRRIIISPSFSKDSLWRISYFFKSPKTGVLYASMHTELETVEIAAKKLVAECAGLKFKLLGIKAIV